MYFYQNLLSPLPIKKGGKTSIEIYNDGEPIKSEQLPHIFERFYTGDKGNTGIGLSMAADIVKYHSGNMEVINRDDGVSFIVSIKQL